MSQQQISIQSSTLAGPETGTIGVQPRCDKVMQAKQPPQPKGLEEEMQKLRDKLAEAKATSDAYKQT